MGNTTLPPDKNGNVTIDSSLEVDLRVNDNSSKNTQDFIALANRLAAVAASEGLEAPKVGDVKNLKFSKLESIMQTEVLRRFSVYVEVCEKFVADGYSLLDEKQMLWATVKRLKLKPLANLFEDIADTDIIEIYDLPEFVQIFRSYRFFYLCSYTLDDLLSRPWWELYYRDPEINAKVMERAQFAATMANPGAVYYGIGEHTISEIDSVNRLKCTQELRFMSPLLDSEGRIAALVNIVRPYSVVATKGNDIGMDLLAKVTESFKSR